MKKKLSFLLTYTLNLETFPKHVPVRRILMPNEEHFINKTDEMIEEFIENCEREAAKLEITVDYYLAEFI